MTRSPKHPSHPPSTPRWPWIAAPAAIALAFVLGRSTVDASPASGAPPRERQPAPARRAAALAAVAPPVAAAPPAAPIAPAVTAVTQAEAEGARARVSRLRTPLSPEAEARMNDDARAAIERARPHVVARCWPRDGLPGGRRRTTITYNVTFDPDGHEIGRGLLDDRRAPAGEFGKCLRRLGETPLSVSPPGTFVTLRLPVTYP
jgi:hypothetical protein